MKKREIRSLGIMLTALLPALVLAEAKPEPINKAHVKPAHGNHLLRTFNWTGADKKAKQVSFSLSKSRIKRELNKFGVPRGQENALLLQKKGFKHIGVSKGVEVYMVNYQEVFLRNLEYFRSLTQILYDAIKPQPPERQLMEFLVFVQAITYKKPPFYYNNKFINSFFPPLICLYEQSGDCDSKSVLLAVFLTSDNNEEKTALLFINHLGLKHSILLVKRMPSPGMSAIFIKGKGYYIPLETSSPGWAPGFVNQRIWSAITSGNFRFSELQ
ncbi:MAG: hypothetical protein JXI33_06875 [Candidatus Aminicenantes bacterium]|nr:hypothetical protein [Candidatus Aminicenantes bacterium]